MNHTTILAGWDDAHSQLWGRQPIRLAHQLHQSPLFTTEKLARLIERYPREHYSLVLSGGVDGDRVWREGEIGALSGDQVLSAIAAGRFWLNLRNVDHVDARYGAVLDELCAEIGAKVPHFAAATRGAGILISSPRTKVYYHVDLPAQMLIQIVGHKRVYVYPATPPFVTPEDLESIALFDVEVDITPESWFDDHAAAFDFEPGQLLSWPLNAPHRVENLDDVNVSMTVSYADRDIRYRQVVSRANGILRHRCGYQPRSRATSGVSFWTKALMQEVLRHGPWVKRRRRERRAVDFRLDAEVPGRIVDLA
ncbi:MAG: hypothetical protein ABL993_03465 [Vicinamibacterales bacterium]